MEERRQKQKEYLLGWLGAVDSHQDYDVYFSDHISGTSEWLLEEEKLKAWLSTDRSDVFWLSGKAGTGKTYLVTHLITHLTQTNKHVVYFYCQFDDPAKRTTLCILRSLSVQLLEQIPLPDDYKAVYEEHRGKNQTTLDDIETIVTGLEILLRCLPWRVHIVLDGLDEVSDRETLATVLERLCFRSRRGITKWFLSCHTVPSAFWSKGKYELKHLDIATDCRMKMEKDIKKMIEQYNWAASDEAENALLYRADGNILWANLALRTLDKEHMAVREEYDRIQIIEELERGLFQVFLRALKRWTERPANEMKLARMYLNFISAAVRPLTSDELDDAIGFGREGLISQQPEWYNRRESAMLFYRTSIRTGHCALLQHVKVKRSGQTIIRLAHKQFRDFLSLDPTTDPFGCHISPRTSTFFLNAKGTESMLRGDLGLSCFFYLLGNERYRNSPDQGYHDLNPGSLPDDEFDKLLDNRTHSFLVYAATHWFIHVSDWNEEMQKHYTKEILRFIDSDNFIFTTRVQARRAGHLLFGNCNHFLLPSWLKNVDTEEAKRLVWQYELFIQEWGYVLAASAGDLNRIATYDGSYPWFFSRHNRSQAPTYDSSYTRHSLATVIGPASIQSHRRTFDSSGCLRKEYESIPHSRISALHDTGGGSFSPEMMVLDSEARTLELTWSEFGTGAYSLKKEGVNEHMLVSPPDYHGKECKAGPITKRVKLPDDIVKPAESDSVFRVETARRGSKIALSIIYAHKEVNGKGPIRRIALGVLDIEAPEGSTDPDAFWFDLPVDYSKLDMQLAYTSTPIFHPTQPLVIWAVDESLILAGNYETGRVDPFVTEFSLGSEASGDDGDEEEGSIKDNKSEDGGNESPNRNADDSYTVTIALHFISLKHPEGPDLLITKLKSTSTSSTLTSTIHPFPTNLHGIENDSEMNPLLFPNYSFESSPKRSSPQVFTWSTPRPISSPFSPSPYTLTMTDKYLLLTYYHGIDVTLVRIPYAHLYKHVSKREYETLITGISLPTSSREPNGIWRDAPKIAMLTGADLGEKDVKNDVLVWGLKSDEGVEESVAWLLVERGRWEKKPVVPEVEKDREKVDDTESDGGEGRSKEEKVEENGYDESEGVVDLSGLYGEETSNEPERLFKEEGVVVPVRSGLKWNKPDYAICCMRR